MFNSSIKIIVLPTYSSQTLLVHHGWELRLNKTYSHKERGSMRHSPRVCTVIWVWGTRVCPDFICRDSLRTITAVFLNILDQGCGEGWSCQCTGKDESYWSGLTSLKQKSFFPLLHHFLFCSFNCALIQTPCLPILPTFVWMNRKYAKSFTQLRKFYRSKGLLSFHPTLKSSDMSLCFLASQVFPRARTFGCVDFALSWCNQLR